MRIQFDVADRELIERQPWRAFAQRHTGAARSNLCLWRDRVADRRSGRWLGRPHPTRFSTDHAIARLGEQSFARRQRSGNAERAGHFFALCQRVWGDLRGGPAHLPFTNWYAAVTNGSANSAA